MSIAYQFSLDAKIKNVEALFRAAMDKVQGNGLSKIEALALFKPDGQTIYAQACLIEMLDPGEIPGCEVQNSDAAHVSNEGLEYSIARRPSP